MDERITRTRPAKKSPRISRTVLITASVALLFIANFRFGFFVTVGGRELAGVYSPRMLLTAVDSAEAAAAEILGESVSLRSLFEVRPQIITGDYSLDTLALERSLLDNTPGITRMCAVRVDGEFIGWVREQSEFGDLLDSLLGEKCTIYTVSAGFTKKITAQYSYASAALPADALELSRKIREMDIIQVVDIVPQIPDGGLPPGVIW